MATQLEPQFSYQRGRHYLVPIGKEPEHFKLLAELYEHIFEEGLNEIVFHEVPDTSCAQWIAFATAPSTLVQLFADSSDQEKMRIAGASWLSAMDSPQGLTRGIGSFVFLREYQNPNWTTQFGRMALEFWFQILGLKSLLGSTPAANRAALAYVHRLGLKEIGRLVNHTVYGGRACDAVITQMTALDFFGGNNGKASG